jgi:hypothetical protein
MQEEKRSLTRALPQVHKERTAGDGSLTDNGMEMERTATTIGGAPSSRSPLLQLIAE